MFVCQSCIKTSICKAYKGPVSRMSPSEVTVPTFCIGPKRQALLKGLCHYDIAVFGQFCAEVII